MENIEFGKFTIKSYTKAELAMRYGIHRSTLMRWIEPIRHKLEASGYVKTQKHFTSMEVEMIVSKLGAP